jgi:hypothetical protein
MIRGCVRHARNAEGGDRRERLEGRAEDRGQIFLGNPIFFYTFI